MAMLFDEGSPLSKITTLRPKDYSEARTIGERYRDGTPVIMDLVTMDNADAKRLVDFAAGLAFALRGSFDKVATKVFLLSPPDVEVTPEERRRMAEAGFYGLYGRGDRPRIAGRQSVGCPGRRGKPLARHHRGAGNVTIIVVRSASLAVFFQILGFALFVFWLLLIARIVVEFVRSFSRDWHPRGVTVVILETIMTVTDPPVKLLRRLIPQLTIGALRFDLSIMVLLLLAFIGMQLAFGAAV